MTEPDTGFQAYAIQYSEEATRSRKQLPPDVLLVLFDVIDALAEDPDGRPERTTPLSRDGRIRVYKHSQPPLEVTYEVERDRRVVYLLHFVAPKLQVTKPVFISYCHKDAEWLLKLRMFLRPLEDRGLMRVWDDRDIKPGSEWLEDIRRSLGAARVAVFLITQNFLNSEFIREKELPALLEKAKAGGCLVFWIAVSASTVEDSEIARFQAANDPNLPLDKLSEADQNGVFKSLYDRMKEVVQV
jgi:mRNA-degrading endonuclease RelE of RelBE toxin-antitoxin system